MNSEELVQIMDDDDEEIEVEDIIKTVETIADGLIYTENIFKDYLAEQDPRVLLSGLLLSIKATQESNKIIEENVDKNLKEIDENLQEMEEFLKSKQEENSKLKNEFRTKQNFANQCEKSVQALRSRIDALQKQKDGLRDKRHQILVLKLLTNTSFQFKSNNICGYMIGNNEKIEAFNIASGQSQDKVVNALWKKVKENNEI